jgi:hypothetical protein
MVCLLIVLFWPGSTQQSIYPLLFFIFAMGVFNSGKVAVGFCWMCELAPGRVSNLIAAIWNSSEGAIYIYLTIFFIYYKPWQPPQYLALAVYAISLVSMILFLPESPKWLLDQGRIQECL